MALLCGSVRWFNPLLVFVLNPQKNHTKQSFARRINVSPPPFADEVCKDTDLRLAHQAPHHLWEELLNSFVPPFAVDLLIFVPVFVALAYFAFLFVSACFLFGVNVIILLIAGIVLAILSFWRLIKTIAGNLP